MDVLIWKLRRSFADASAIMPEEAMAALDRKGEKKLVPLLLMSIFVSNPQGVL